MLHETMVIMKTVQMTLDENLVIQVDNIVKQLNTTRSAFARDALRQAIGNHQKKVLEDKHRKGYQNQPVSGNEFSVWEDEQDWGEE